jgi:hypothetical protein
MLFLENNFGLLIIRSIQSSMNLYLNVMMNNLNQHYHYFHLISSYTHNNFPPLTSNSMSTPFHNRCSMIEDDLMSFEDNRYH